MSWDDRGNLRCDGGTGRQCAASFQERGSKEATRTASRARGWHLSDEEWRPFAHLCPGCLKVPRSELPSKAEPMAEDVPLFDIVVPPKKVDTL